MIKIDRNKIKRILFISLSNVGDIILTTPVLKVLSESFPEARLDIMVGPKGGELFKHHPAVFKVIIYDKHIPVRNKQRLIKKLRKVKYDLIIDMRNSLFPILLGAKYRTSPIHNAPRLIRHKKQQHLWKLSAIGLYVADAPFFVHIPPEDDDYIKKTMMELDGNKPIIAISPGAKSEIKRWTKEGFTELTNQLMEEFDAQVLMVGDGPDSYLIKDIMLSMKNEVMDLSGKTTLCQLAALLKRCDLLITNDSAPLHIAEAVGAKVLAIFGPTDSEVYGPRGEKSRVVRKDLHCSPCEKAQCEFEHECMRNINVDEVFKVAKEMLHDVIARKE